MHISQIDIPMRFFKLPECYLQYYLILDSKEGGMSFFIRIKDKQIYSVKI